MSPAWTPSGRMAVASNDPLVLHSPTAWGMFRPSRASSNTPTAVTRMGAVTWKRQPTVCAYCDPPSCSKRSSATADRSKEALNTVAVRLSTEPAGLLTRTQKLVSAARAGVV